ncbi:hypothetical protein MKW94_012201, partial [Papaver nudicaule]|nr:hypothetical protein [Papaver nudicaule]
DDWVSVLEGDEDDSDETLGDWAELETMRSCHPTYFAKNMSENSYKVDIKKVGTAKGDSKDNIINGQQDKSSSTDLSEDGADQSGKDLNSRTSFYMLEMAKIQLNRYLTHLFPLLYSLFVEVNEYQNAKPDAIAHSADKIMSRLKAGGEKTAQALKSLCLRVKGIQVEEAIVIGVDSLGFVLRVCSGTQFRPYGLHLVQRYKVSKIKLFIIIPVKQKTFWISLNGVVKHCQKPSHENE